MSRPPHPTFLEHSSSIHHSFQDLPSSKPPARPRCCVHLLSEARSRNVQNVCCETFQTRSVIPSSLPAAPGSLFILLRSFLVSHLFSLFFTSAGICVSFNRGIPPCPAKLLQQLELRCMPSAARLCDWACTGEHLCREERWEMMLHGAPSQEYLSHSDISTRPTACTHEHSRTRAEVHRHVNTHTKAPFSFFLFFFITHNKSPIF